MSMNSKYDDILDKKLENTQKKKKTKRFIIELAVCLAVTFIVFRFIIGVMIVSGQSMQPALMEGDMAIFWRIGRPYKKNDMVVFSKNGSIYVKRIIGLPGDVIDIDNSSGDVLINDKKEDFGGVYFPTTDTYSYVEQSSFPMTLGENEYFVLGDNREHSKDSRASDVGLVGKEDIKGRLIILFRKNDSDPKE